MSFPFGGRSSFRDKTKGQSGNEIFEDMLKNIKERKKEFFESPPRWRTAGMFDDELGTAGGSRFKDHLGDLATRHPELADHLVDLLPHDRKPTIPKDQNKSEEHRNTSQKIPRTEVNKPSQTSTGTQTSSQETDTATQTTGLESDIKLRNTVPDMQASAGESVTDADRGQRSQSAPPQTSVPNKQVPWPDQQQMPPHYQSQQQNFQHPPHNVSDQSSRPQEESKGPTVRHIPIFVEGRDEPIIPKDANPASGMKRGGCQGKPDSSPRKKGPPPEEKKQQAQPQEQQPQNQQSPTPTPPQRPDLLAIVAEIMKEVEALSVKVNEWNGSSRTEKEYIYLDEMLTRNLLKLDNVETEGREEVRTARREAIKSIQAAISVLESKTDTENVQKNQQGTMDCPNNEDNSGPKGLMDTYESLQQMAENNQNQGGGCTTSHTQT